MSEIDEFLAEIKKRGLSAPSGLHWERLRKLLVSESKVPDGERLLNPLILGGSIGTHVDKHQRLAWQLAWADRHQCLGEALNYLRNLPKDSWNKTSGDDWNKVHPWLDGDEW